MVFLFDKYPQGVSRNGEGAERPFAPSNGACAGAR